MREAELLERVVTTSRAFVMGLMAGRQHSLLRATIDFEQLEKDLTDALDALGEYREKYEPDRGD